MTGVLSKFQVHDKVWKKTGDYNLPGRVMTSGKTEAGKTLIQVEHPFGFCHVYGEANLEPLTDAHMDGFKTTICNKYGLIKPFYGGVVEDREAERLINRLERNETTNATANIDMKRAAQVIRTLVAMRDHSNVGR